VKRFSLTHLSDAVLCRELSTVAANEKVATAGLIAHIAEFDQRKLYLPAAYPSMLAYCVGKLGLSEDAAAKRIQVARVARACPEVLDALAEGWVHLTGLRLLAPHLTPQTVHELLAAAGGKSKSDIERLVAERFPRAEVSARVEPIAASIGAAAGSEHAPGHVADADSHGVTVAGGAPAQPLHARVAPLSAHAFAVQFTRSGDADERFRYLQDLLGHQVSRGDIAEAYDRAVKALIEKMERVRFGACELPRAVSAGSSDDPRHISARVKREAWKRDGGQCTFVSESGHRCEARGDVEFDHVTEVVRGGEATEQNLRLRCRGHNQHSAEQAFGAGFMKAKREEAKAAAAKRRVAREEAKAAAGRRRAEREKQAEESRLQPHQLEVIPWLRQLGCREDESRLAVERCREMADAALEDRVKRALSWFGTRLGRKESYVGCAATVRAGAPA